jgi:hypothetical protein
MKACNFDDEKKSHNQNDVAIKSSISCFSDISFGDDYGLLVFKATFNNISVINILLQSSLLMEDAGVPVDAL